MPFNDILSNIALDTTTNDPVHLIKLVEEADIHLSNHQQQTEGKLKELTLLLLERPDLAQALRSYLIQLYSDYNAFSLYTDAGILPGHGIFSEAYRRLKYKILPPLQDATQTQFLINKVFYNRHDYQHLHDINESVWLELFDSIAIDPDV